MDKRESAAQAALHAAACERFAQTVLLCGEAGCGKTALANKLAQTLLCTGTGTRPCQTCSSCHKVQEGIHPDLTILDEGDAEIKIDIARALRRDILIRPNDGARRVVIVRHAHRMNLATQNALLKTLEDPPSFAFFILTSAHPDALLQTILSRCTKYELAPACQADIPDDTLLPFLRPIVGALGMGDEVSLFKACIALESLTRMQQKTLLLLFQTALRDALFVANGMTNALLPTLSSEVHALARTVPATHLLRVTTLVTTLLSRLEHNASGAATSTALCAGAYAICFTQTASDTGI